MDIGAFATAAGSAINSLVGSASNANLNATNRRWQAEQSTINYQRQRDLIRDSPALQKQGLINAGYSPAALGGYSGPSANVSSASSPNASSSEFVPMDSRVLLDAFLAKKQGEVADSQVRKNDADAVSQELENKAKKELQEGWSHATEHKYFYTDDGKKVYGDDPDFEAAAQKYYDKHHSLPDLIVEPGVHSEAAASISSKMAKMSTEQLQSEFASNVLQLKMADKDTMKAIYSMDKAQFDQLLETANKLRSDQQVNKSIIEYNDAKTSESKQAAIESAERVVMLKLQEKLQKNSNIANLIDQLDFSNFENGLRSLAKLLIVGAVGNNGGVLH